MERGEWTAREITELYLRRIEEVDRSGPTLRSVIEVNPDAPEIAAELDRERREGKVRGPLHGGKVCQEQAHRSACVVLQGVRLDSQDKTRRSCA